MTARIGFIGLGIMGKPMAQNLSKAGYPLAVYARRPDMMDPLVSTGATACEDPQAVAAQSDIIFTIVSDTPDVEQVILGEQGVIQGAQAGSVVVDMSTISPSATRHMAELLAKKGIQMLDAPVSGGEQGAIDGTLSIMVGGKEETFQTVLPLFEVMGKNIVHVGEHGAGQVTKACNQIVIAQTLVAVSAYLGWYYAYRKGGLVSDNVPANKSEELLKQNLAEPITALLTMPFAFVGPIAWELSWFLYPFIRWSFSRFAKKTH